MKKGLVLMAASVLIVLTGCSQSFEDKLIGHWERVDEDEGCSTELEEGFYFKEDGSVEGIEMFKTYEVEEKDGSQTDIVLDGTLAETTRYIASIDEDEILSIRKETDAEGMACNMQKVDE